MTRSRDIADTQDNLGGAVPPITAGKNFAINGGFDFWQRGTSSTSSGVYLSDRWIHGRSGGASGGTYTRQTATDSSTLPFLQYSFRLQRDSGNTGTAQFNLNQVIETVNSLPLAGKTVTLSFYARVGANFSATSGTVIAYLFTGTGTDQNGALGAWTGSANPLSTSWTGATTSWQRFQATTTLSNTTNEIFFGIGFNPTGTAGAADWLEIAGVQLEQGSAATPFSRAGGTIQGELAACQRYYIRWTGGAAYHPYGMGFATSATAGAVLVYAPVQMRVTPTALDYSTIYLEDYASTSSTTGTPALSNGGPIVTKINFTGLSGMTAGRGIYIFSNNDANGYLGLSAEL